VNSSQVECELSGQLKGYEVRKGSGARGSLEGILEGISGDAECIPSDISVRYLELITQDWHGHCKIDPMRHTDIV
jgi:hypothetical protein